MANYPCVAVVPEALETLREGGERRRGQGVGRRESPEWEAPTVVSEDWG